MSGELLDPEWDILFYYSDGRVIHRKSEPGNYTQTMIDRQHSEYQTHRVMHHDDKPVLLRISIIAPDWYPARTMDSQSGNIFATTEAEKYHIRSQRAIGWRPRGIFRRTVKQDTQKEPGY